VTCLKARNVERFNNASGLACGTAVIDCQGLLPTNERPIMTSDAGLCVWAKDSDCSQPSDEGSNHSSTHSLNQSIIQSVIQSLSTNCARKSQSGPDCNEYVWRMFRRFSDRPMCNVYVRVRFGNFLTLEFLPRNAL